MDKLYDELMAVSHPDSPHFGKHWSPQKVADFFRPSQETTDTVKAWLADAGFDPAGFKLANGGHWIEVQSTINQAEQVSLL
jgi:tripeptidyl-peptidase-1